MATLKLIRAGEYESPDGRYRVWRLPQPSGRWKVDEQDRGGSVINNLGIFSSLADARETVKRQQERDGVPSEKMHYFCVYRDDTEPRLYWAVDGEWTRWLDQAEHYTLRGAEVLRAKLMKDTTRSFESLSIGALIRGNIKPYA